MLSIRKIEKRSSIRFVKHSGVTDNDAGPISKHFRVGNRLNHCSYNIKDTFYQEINWSKQLCFKVNCIKRQSISSDSNVIFDQLMYTCGIFMLVEFSSQIWVVGYVRGIRN